jgi:predicted nucleotidyltransferase
MRRLDEITLSAKDRAAVEAAAKVPRERFPVEEVVLYGSKARGDDRPDSDIDLLVLMDREMSWQEQQVVRDALYDVMLEHDVLFQTIIESKSEWWDGPHTFLLIVQETAHDGVLIG